MTGSRFVWLRLLVLALVVTSGCSRSDPFEEPWPGKPPVPRVEIVADFTQAREGRVPVTMRLTGVEDDEFRFQLRGSEEEYQVHEVRFTDGRGRTIDHEQRGIVWDLAPFQGDVVHAHYQAQPGGIGRHGAQGGVAEDWALFDGRLYLSPKNETSLRAARFRFIRPEGWNVVSAFREEAGWYYLDMYAPENIPRLLEKSCVGVGRFEQDVRRIGEMDVRVASYAGWPDDHKQKLAESTFKIAEYFHETLGFDLRAPYSVVWAPRFEGQRIFGGSFVNGTCFEHDVYALRGFELLAHRMGHSMNKYEPAGMSIRNTRDRWFQEGWASYIEVVVTQATGIAEVEERPSWESLHSRYKKSRYENPEWDIASDRRAHGRRRHAGVHPLQEVPADHEDAGQLGRAAIRSNAGGVHAGRLGQVRTVPGGVSRAAGSGGVHRRFVSRISGLPMIDRAVHRRARLGRLPDRPRFETACRSPRQLASAETRCRESTCTTCPAAVTSAPSSAVREFRDCRADAPAGVGRAGGPAVSGGASALTCSRCLRKTATRSRVFEQSYPLELAPKPVRLCRTVGGAGRRPGARGRTHLRRAARTGTAVHVAPRLRGEAGGSPDADCGRCAGR